MADHANDGFPDFPDERVMQAAALLNLNPQVLLEFTRQQMRQVSGRSSRTLQRSSIAGSIGTDSTAQTTPPQEPQGRRQAGEDAMTWPVSEQTIHNFHHHFHPSQANYLSTFDIPNWSEAEGLVANNHFSAFTGYSAYQTSPSLPIPTIEEIIEPPVDSSAQLVEDVTRDAFLDPDPESVSTTRTATAVEYSSHDDTVTFEAPNGSFDTASALVNHNDAALAPPPGLVIPVQAFQSVPSLPKLAAKPTKQPSRGRYGQAVEEQVLSSAVTRQRRKAYAREQRQETNKTRKSGNCLRCKRQRIRCIPNPGGEHLPCLTCLKAKAGPKYSNIGCSRSKIADCVLFRTGVGVYTFYQKHLMVGPTYGDFHLQDRRMWVNDEIHVLEITQDMGPRCRFAVRQFVPPEEPDAVDLKGRSMYHVPWAIADVKETERAFAKFLDDSLVPYLKSILNDDDYLFYEVFTSAIKIGFPGSANQPILLVRNALRLWVACRFIEGKWRCCGADTLGAGELRNPFRSLDWISPPPYIDYQYASIIMHAILGPLSKVVLKGLQALVDDRKPKDWYTVFLVTFILLHNYERGMLFQRAFWAKRRMTHMYHDMSLIRAMHQGAKTLLADFHVSCRGNVPFGKNFDWNSKDSRKVADIGQDEAEFLTRLGILARQKEEDMKFINRSHNYETPYWFTSQMFEENWTHRETYEHSPEAQPWPPPPIFGPVAPPRGSGATQCT